MGWVLLLAAGQAATLTARPASTPLVVDGRLDEPAWAEAKAAAAFTQKLPEAGATAVEPTVVRVLYDRAALYVGFWCEQRRDEVVARLTRRDRRVESDWVEL